MFTSTFIISIFCWMLNNDTEDRGPQVTSNLWNSLCTVIKRKIEFSSYTRKFRMEQLQSLIWLFPHILGSPSSYMTLQLLHFEFPYIWGKFDFLFYHCILLQINHQPTTAYTIQRLGWVESLHHRVKDALTGPRRHNYLDRWPIGYNNLSPAQAVYWVPLVLPRQNVLIPSMREKKHFITE